MNEKPGQVPIFVGDGTSYLPFIYVASALSSLTADEQTALDGWCSSVNRAAVPLEGPTWVRVHTPFKQSAPWLEDGRSSEEIYRANRTYLCSEADGLILFAWRGGSIGSGQELAWAQMMAIPVLVLAYGRDPAEVREGERSGPENADRISRQLRGTASETDLEIHWFTGAEQLETVVRKWLSQKRKAIEDRNRLRRMHRQRAATPLTVFRAAAARLGASAATEVEAATRLDAGRVEALLASEDALLAASLEELFRLSTGLGVELGEAISPRRRTLMPKQLEALQQAAMENEWSPETVVAAVESGQLAMASDGVRRLPLSSPEAWVEFMRRGGP
jgi:ribosomal protein L13E